MEVSLWTVDYCISVLDANAGTYNVLTHTKHPQRNNNKTSIVCRSVSFNRLGRNDRRHPRNCHWRFSTKIGREPYGLTPETKL